MAKKRKPKIGVHGPRSYWLDIPIPQRDRLKQYIKESFNGYVRPDGVSIPPLRKVYSGFEAKHGYDLRHIERWSKPKLDAARRYIQSLNTLTSRPFQVLRPTNKKQRKNAQTYTGQNLDRQKQFIVQVQDPRIDRVSFRDGKVTVTRQFRKGAQQIKQRYLFEDYLEWETVTKKGKVTRHETSKPETFQEMVAITKRMLPDMPKEYRKQWVYYTLLTVQYGPIGQSVPHDDILKLLYDYHMTYDAAKNHEAFAEQVIGFQMIGTFKQASDYQIRRDAIARQRRQMKKLRFQKMTKRQRVKGN